MKKFTIMWFKEFWGSLIRINPQVKKAVELKKTGDWATYKPYVDECL